MPVITRRAFLQSACAAVLAGCATAPSTTAKRPNVLFIAVDDLNDWVGFLGGHPNALTPNLDRLAARSTVFTRAYCAAPLCNPSRAALMFGIQPARSGVYGNGDDWRAKPALAGRPTLNRHFQANGYAVLGSGKIYHGPFQDPDGWDVYWPSNDKTMPDDIDPPRIPYEAGPAAVGTFDWGPLDVDDAATSDGQVAAWTAEQLGRDYDRPFFLACGIFHPHLPWYTPRKYFDMHPLDQIVLPEINETDHDDLPPFAREIALAGGDHERLAAHGKVREAVQAYLASISFADACIGRVLDALEASPHRDNTLVVLWSDHGWHLGEKFHWRKRTLWEEGTRNLLLFAGPGVPEGQRCGRPVSLLDVYPTLAERCGLGVAGDLDGQSLSPLIADPHRAWDRPALTTHLEGNHSLRTERWRYIRYHDGTEELYDHHADAMEWTNLAGKPEHAPVIADLKQWLPTP